MKLLFKHPFWVLSGAVELVSATTYVVMALYSRAMFPEAGESLHIGSLSALATLILLLPWLCVALKVVQLWKRERIRAARIVACAASILGVAVVLWMLGWANATSPLTLPIESLIITTPVTLPFLGLGLIGLFARHQPR